tara:strand:+ start:3982 stop:4368 length:387 start_codon:yes stop_codon:yes gene_type:complete
MNQLINIIYLMIALYFGIPRLNLLTDDIIFQKVYIVTAIFGLEILFDSFTRIVRKDNFNVLAILDKSIVHSLLILLGYLLYQDFKNSPELTSRIPGLTELFIFKNIELLIYVTPMIMFTASKSFLKPY